MSEKTPFWKQPQNYIIAILLLGIVGYIGYQQLQPKTNKLAQASAYFDAIDAEERAEAEKKRAAEEKEKARLAVIEMEKAKAEAIQALQTAKQAEQKLANRSRTTAAATEQESDEPRRYELKRETACNQSDQLVSCTLICRDQYGDEVNKHASVFFVPAAGIWQSNDIQGNFYSSSAYFSAVCRAI